MIHPDAASPGHTSLSRTKSCSHCGASSKPPTNDQRARPVGTGPRRRGLLRRRQSLSSASVPSTPIRSRPRNIQHSCPEMRESSTRLALIISRDSGYLTDVPCITAVGRPTRERVMEMPTPSSISMAPPWKGGKKRLGSQSTCRFRRHVGSRNRESRGRD